MTTTKSFIQKHAVLAYFLLTFAITWGGIILVIGLGGILGTEPVPDEQLPALYLAVLLGPSMAGLIMTGLADGKAGYRALFARLGNWRVAGRWYAAALLTAPVLITTILLILSKTSPAFIPELAAADDKATLLITGIVMGLVVGFLEELGWTGFALPRMRQKRGILASGIILGLLWGLWHFPLFSGSAELSGSIPPAVYLVVLLFSFLPAYRVLMVWIYDRTGSLFVTALMHAPLSASQMIVIPAALSGAQFVTYDLVFTAALWILVGIVTAASIRKQPLEDAEAVR
jgi:membrane protease YdiL (CAAX protease family)